MLRISARESTGVSLSVSVLYVVIKSRGARASAAMLMAPGAAPGGVRFGFKMRRRPGKELESRGRFIWGSKDVTLQGLKNNPIPAPYGFVMPNKTNTFVR